MVVLKARHWQWATAIAGLLAVIGWWHGAQPVAMPLLVEALPLRTLVAVAVVPVALYPLHDWYPQLSPALARETALRPVRAAASIVLATVSVGAALTGAELGPAELHAEVALASALMAVGFAAVVAVGDFSWLIVLAVGLSTLVADGGPAQPVSAALGRVPLLVELAVLVAAAGAYAAWGPRRRT